MELGHYLKHAEKDNAILHGSMVYGVSGGPERPGRTYYVTHRCI